MPARFAGDFTVVGSEVATGVHVARGEFVRTVSHGYVNFGGGVYIGVYLGGDIVVNADGENAIAPDDCPAPGFRKNSLICRVGGRWYQGGTDGSFRAETEGELVLYCNDAHPADNKGGRGTAGWTVGIRVVPAHEALVDGSLLKEQSRPEVYVIYSGRKYHVPNPYTLDAMGLDSGSMVVVPDGSLSAVPTIPPIGLTPTSTPGSLVYPPDGSKWHARTDIPGTRLRSGGKEVRVVELRGWLRALAAGAKTSEDRWYDTAYDIEIDPASADEAGIDMGLLLLPGEIVYNNLDTDPWSNYYRAVAPPIIHVELNAWAPGKVVPPAAAPPDWIQSADARFTAEARWPFEPLKPLEGKAALGDLDAKFGPDAEGPYVKIVGSLLSDVPHSTEGVFGTWFSRQFNISDSYKSVTRAVLQVWGAGRTEEDKRHPGRYNEIHPPDRIELLPPKKRVETVRGVAVVARNGLAFGDSETLQVDIYPPGPRPQGALGVGWSESVGPETNFHTIFEGNDRLDGARVTVHSDRITIRVGVRGEGGWGAPGKFKAVYRVRWLMPGMQAGLSWAAAGPPKGAGPHRVTCIRKRPRLNRFGAIQAIGGVNADGTPWLMKRLDVVEALQHGTEFYVEGRAKGSRTKLTVARRMFRPPHVRTEADRFRSNNLLRLPEC